MTTTSTYVSEHIEDFVQPWLAAACRDLVLVQLGLTPTQPSNDGRGLGSRIQAYRGDGGLVVDTLYDLKLTKEIAALYAKVQPSRSDTRTSTRITMATTAGATPCFQTLK